MKLIACLTAMLLAGLGPLLAADPSSQEQLLIYELNRARNNPARYQAEHSGVVTSDLSSVTAQMPLALNADLLASAQFRATESVVSNYCAHESPVTGLWPDQVARSFGYQLPLSYPDANNFIEGLRCESGPISETNTVAEDSLAALIEDEGNVPPSNRNQLLAIDPFFQANREIGTGISFLRTNVPPHIAVSIRIAIQTAEVNTNDLFLTGVVYADANGNHRYDLNEGLGGVTIDNGITNVVTGAAGGWAIPVTAGPYTVTASGGPFSSGATAQVTVVDRNIEVDFRSGVSSGEVDFADQVVATPTHDLAVITLKAPKKITLSATVTNVTGRFSVSIENLSTNSETIANVGVLTNLVTVLVQSLGACPDIQPTLVTPTVMFPLVLAPKKKLTLAFTANFNCINDPLPTSKLAAHNDYQTTVTLHHEALGDGDDTVPANNVCPRPPNPATGDKGCNKGLAAFIDVIQK